MKFPTLLSLLIPSFKTFISKFFFFFKTQTSPSIKLSLNMHLLRFSYISFSFKKNNLYKSITAKELYEPQISLK